MWAPREPLLQACHSDVLEYAQKRDQERRAALDRLSRAAVEAGLYDRNTFPEGGQDE